MREVQTCALTIVVCGFLSTANACGSSNDTERGATTPTAAKTSKASPTSSSTSARAAPASARRLGPALRAVRTAQRKVQGSKAYDIETDRLRGRRVWEVKLARGLARPYELDVRADGRKVVRQRRLRIDNDVRKAAKARIALSRALKTASRRANGARFDEAEIDRARGRIIFSGCAHREGSRGRRGRLIRRRDRPRRRSTQESESQQEVTDANSTT